MKKFIGGALAVIIGLPGLALFFSDFYSLLAGGVPILLILGGGLAFYLGYEDIKAEDTKPNDETIFQDKAIDDEPSMSQSEQAAPEVTPPLEKVIETSPPVKADDVTASGTAQFMGNTETLVFHSITCNFAKGKKCTQEFTSKDEALDQGYKPCKVCAA